MTEGVFPKTNGQELYASEVNAFNKSIVSYTIGNNFAINVAGAKGYNECDNTIMELFSDDTAASKTNLTHSTARDEYYSITDGAYELITDAYETEDNCTKCGVYFDYGIYKELSETTLTSSISGTGTDSDNGADIIGEKYIFGQFYINATGIGGGSSTAAIRLTDGTSTSTIITISQSSASGTSNNLKATGFYKIINNTTTKLAKIFIWYYRDTTKNVTDDEYYYYITYSYSEIDYSGWGSSNLYLQTYATATETGGSNDTASANIYYQRAYKQNPSTTATISVSADGGSNYTEVTNGTVAWLSAGNNFKAKISGTLAANEGINIKKVILRPEA